MCPPRYAAMMMMIAFITFKSSLVPLFEGLWSWNSWEFELSGFSRNRTDDLGIDSPSLWPTEPRLHVRSTYCLDFAVLSTPIIYNHEVPASTRVHWTYPRHVVLLPCLYLLYASNHYTAPPHAASDSLCAHSQGPVSCCVCCLCILSWLFVGTFIG